MLSKRKLFNRSRGFLSVEVAVMVFVIVAALIGVSIYMKRAISGKMRAAGDSFGGGRQYSP